MDEVWEKKNAILVWNPEWKNDMEDLILVFRAILRRTSR